MVNAVKIQICLESNEVIIHWHLSTSQNCSVLIYVLKYTLLSCIKDNKSYVVSYAVTFSTCLYVCIQYFLFRLVFNY